MHLYCFPAAERLRDGEKNGYIGQIQDLVSRIEDMHGQYGVGERDIVSDLLYLIVAKDIARLLEEERR